MNKIPSGVVHFFEPISSLRRETENKILNLFKDRGYQEIITPTFVYEDSVSEFLFEPLKDKLFKLVDRANGKTMILRADITLQITQAVLLGDFDMPMRVCYAENVYRDIKEHLGQKRELKQVGVELFGVKELDADVEVVSLALESLELLGFKDIHLKVSDTSILQRLIEEYSLSRDEADRLESFVYRKDISSIENGDFPEGLKRRLNELERESGTVELKKNLNYEAYRLASTLKSRFPHVNVFCDLFYFEYPKYHHGITFDIFVGNKRVVVGGRYGNITKKLGRYIPALGFAIDLDELVQFLFERSSGR